MENPCLRILLIEDDEDDYILVRSLLSEIVSVCYRLDWVPSCEAALTAIENRAHDIYLLDYRLGDGNGIDLLTTVRTGGYRAPFILLTGQGDYDVDVEAMKSGADDYLAKDRIDANQLERSIRYSMERKRAEEALRESEKQLRFLSAQLLKAQEEERRKIARDLHDSIGSSLTAIKFSLENLLARARSGEFTPESLELPIEVTQRAMDESRRIMTDLRPSMLDDLGIVTTVGWFCRQCRSLHPELGIDVRVRLHEEDVPEELKIVIFRVLQESLSNISKYSKALNVTLTLARSDFGIELIVQDNGKGFNVQSALAGDNGRKGMGLTSMKERTELSGGCFEIDSVPGEGTTIRACWLFENAAFDKS